MTPQLSSRDWFGKVAAGVALGFTLALACAGLFKVSLGIGDTFFSTQGQFAMWLMAPVWAFTVSLCFLFGSSARAWAWLGLVNALAWGVLALAGGLRG